MSAFRIVILFFFAIFIAVLAFRAQTVNEIGVQSSKLLVSFTAPGCSPELVEQLGTSPIEAVISQIEGIARLDSESGLGYGVIKITLKEDVNFDLKRFEVLRQLRGVARSLNSLVSFPVLSENNVKGEHPLLVYSVSSPKRLKNLNEEIQSITNIIKSFEGVTKVITEGIGKEKIIVACDKSLLRTAKISIKSIRDIISDHLQNAEVGFLKSNDINRLAIQISTPINAINGLKRIPISQESEIIRLGDVCNCNLEKSTQTEYYRVNGNDALILRVYAKGSTNKLSMGKVLNTLISEEFSKRVGLILKLEIDTTLRIREDFLNVTYKILVSICLLLTLISAYFRNIRAGLIIFLGIVSSCALTSIILFIGNISLNIELLSVAVVSVSIILLNITVSYVAFNTYRNHSSLLPLITAQFILVAGTYTVIFYYTAYDDQNLRNFAQFIVAAVIASVIVAFLFIPGAIKLILPQSRGLNEAILNTGTPIQENRIFSFYLKTLEKVCRFKRVVVILIVLTFGLPVFLLPKRIEKFTLYNLTVGSRTYIDDVKPITDKIFGGTFRLFYKYGYNTVVTSSEETTLHVVAELPLGTSIDQLNQILSNFEAYFKVQKGIGAFTTHIASPQYGHIEVVIANEMTGSNFPQRLRSEVINRALDWAGIKWSIYGVGNGYSNKRNDEVQKYKILVSGFQLHEVQRQIGLIADLLSTNKRTLNINRNARYSGDDQLVKDYFISINKNSNAHRLINLSNLNRTIIEKISPNSQIVHLRNESPENLIEIKEKGTETLSVHTLMESTITVDGKAVKLRDLAKVEARQSAQAIYRTDRQFVQVLEFDYYGGWEIGDALVNSIVGDMSREIPKGYSVKRSETIRTLSDQSYRHVIIVCVFMILLYLICAIHLENLIKPVWILALVPIAFIGIFIAFGVLRYALPAGGYSSFLLTTSFVTTIGLFVLNTLGPKKNNLESIAIKLLESRHMVIVTILTVLCICLPLLLDSKAPDLLSLAIGTSFGLLLLPFSIFVFLPILIYEKK